MHSNIVWLDVEECLKIIFSVGFRNSRKTYSFTMQKDLWKD
jgi:hypothetical protein